MFIYYNQSEILRYQELMFYKQLNNDL